jgi:hypothetical protein
VTTPVHLPYARLNPQIGAGGALVWFFMSAGASGSCLSAAAVYALGQWNTWLGRSGTFLVSVAIVGGMAGIGTCVEWATLAIRRLRGPLVYLASWRACVAGSAFALSVLSPPILDQYLTNGPVLESGEHAASGIGIRLGWLLLFVAPPALSAIIARRGDGRGDWSRGARGGS